MSEKFDIAVIGGGASGVLVVAHCRRIASGRRVALLDARDRGTGGLAYCTPYDAHLLNVPAAKMSALADDAGHFLEWLKRTMPGASGSTFAPRRLYGEYLANVLAEGCKPPGCVVRLKGPAVDLGREESSGRWIVRRQGGRDVVASQVVLALGNLPPADPLCSGDAMPANYLSDPWSPRCAEGLASDAPVLLIGTGLTALDLILALRAEGHRGCIHAISRHGVLPRAHRPHDPRPMSAPRDGRSPRRTLRCLRSELVAADREGHDWRAVIDALRPHTQRVWQTWTAAQRGSFLRHARTLWDVHRHRCAPEVAAAIEAEIEAGTVRIHRGRVYALEGNSGMIARCVSPDGRKIELSVARVINCTGPATDYAKVDIPLVVNLRERGWLVPDALGLGVETDANGQLLCRDGDPVPGLFTIGPLRRPGLWESTAIPEIRTQAADLAALFAGHGGVTRNARTG